MIKSNSSMRTYKQSDLDRFYSGVKAKGKGYSKARTRDLDEKLQRMADNAIPLRPYTLQEIADEIGCSKEAVRLMESKALKVLKMRLTQELKEMKK